MSARLADAVTIFLGVLIEAIPFLLLGVLVSQALARVARSERGFAWLPTGRLASLASAAGIGALFPVCECGNVPVARRLVTRGVPVAAAMVFLLSAPAVNPVVALSTWAAFREEPSMVLYRLGATFVIAVGVGLLLSLHPEPASLLGTRWRKAAAGAEHDHAEGGVRGFARGALAEFVEMGAVLVVGAALAAAVQTAVPRQALLDVGQGPVVSVAVMMLLAVVLSVCSTVDAFVALAYAGTFTDGSLLAFLVFGPMVDIKAILLMLTIFRARTVALVALVVAEATFLLGLVHNYLAG